MDWRWRTEGSCNRQKSYAGIAVELNTWPDDLEGDDIWIMTVDGTHCAIPELNHTMWSQDIEYYSHKYNRAGINYQLGISIAENKLIWVNSPFKAGKNDVSIFTKNGLKNRLLNLKKKAIGDDGYYIVWLLVYNCISTPNIHDSKAVWTFKSKAPYVLLQSCPCMHSNQLCNKTKQDIWQSYESKCRGEYNSNVSQNRALSHWAKKCPSFDYHIKYFQSKIVN